MKTSKASERVGSRVQAKGEGSRCWVGVYTGSAGKNKTGQAIIAWRKGEDESNCGVPPFLGFDMGITMRLYCLSLS